MQLNTFFSIICSGATEKGFIKQQQSGSFAAVAKGCIEQRRSGSLEALPL